MLFPPSFAWLGSTLTAALGEHGAAVLLRILGVAGIAATAWLAAAATQRPLRTRLLVAGAAVLLFPPFAHAVFFGNVGPVATALALLAVALVPRHPIGAAPALALSLAIKPVGAALVPILALRRDSRSGRLPGGLLASLVATAIAGALVLGAGPELAWRFLERNRETWIAPFQLGFVRAAAELGLALPAWLPLALVAVGAALWLRREPPGDPLFRAVAPALALAAAPIVWLHTLALALPIHLRALFGPDAFRAGFRRPIEIAFRVALCAAIWGAGGAGAAEGAPAAVRAFVAALPLAAILLLAARCVADERAAARG